MPYLNPPEFGYGIWKDRADIGDGVDYVNKLRDNPRR